MTLSVMSASLLRGICRGENHADVGRQGLQKQLVEKSVGISGRTELVSEELLHAS